MILIKKIIGKNLLYGIIRPRYDEIFEIIRDKIFDNINTKDFYKVRSFNWWGE